MDVRGRTIAQRTSSRRILLLRSEHDFRIAEPVERRKQLLFDRKHLLDDFMPCSLADRTFRQLDMPRRPREPVGPTPSPNIARPDMRAHNQRQQRLVDRAVEDGVEDGLQVVRRARNAAQHFQDGRLLLDEFGHPILRLRDGPFSVDFPCQISVCK
jgi:hypothetical protein